MSEYAATPSTGKLKLKGVKDSRVDKKKKKNKLVAQENEPSQESVKSNSVTYDAGLGEGRHVNDQVQGQNPLRPMEDVAGTLDTAADSEDIREHLKTEAEKRHDEQRRKRLEERLKKEGVKTHKQRVEELNKYLSNLSEHHDMPKIGPG